MLPRISQQLQFDIQSHIQPGSQFLIHSQQNPHPKFPIHSHKLQPPRQSNSSQPRRHPHKLQIKSLQQGIHPHK